MGEQIVPDYRLQAGLTRRCQTVTLSQSSKALLQTNVEHQFSFCLIILGVCRHWLFYIWQKAKFLAANGRRGANDSNLLFRRVCPGDVAGMPGPNPGGLLSGQAGSLNCLAYPQNRSQTHELHRALKPI